MVGFAEAGDRDISKCRLRPVSDQAPRTDGDSTYADTSASKSLKDVLDGNFGGTLSFGGEYYIARGLSLSAEFGTRFLFGGTDIKYRYDNYQGPEEVALKEKLGLGFTYTTLGLNFYFGGTSLLIVVGVAMDTVSQIEAQLVMRNYEGFLKKTRLRGRR